MKYLFYFYITLIAFILFSCKENTINPNQTDPNLLFTYNELICDFQDSVKVNDSTYYFNAGLWYFVDTSYFSRIKITCDVSSTFDSIGTYGYYSFAIKHKLDSNT